MALTVVTDVSNTLDQRALTWNCGTVAVGDVVAVVMMTDEATNAKMAAPTKTAGTSTVGAITQRVKDETTNKCAGYVYTTVVTGAGTLTMGAAKGTGFTSNNLHGGVAYVCPTADGYSLAATPNVVDTRSTGAPSASLTGTTAGNLLICSNGDWDAVLGSGRAYRGTTTEDGYEYSSGAGTLYHWHQTAAAGANTVGLTAPGAQNFTVVGIEVLLAGAAPPAPRRPLLVGRVAAFRSSSY